ncbi:hypothetical protein [Clostridium lacusfryxellense]|uniref:hypothetical protein n=1 Tax=Clostridium lacusfryxellense TaxID=205328 RepID=UPI001C0C9AC3|nr:hypothetical protein [Clostridium lacusfryxellense]MBU3114530.1 hypothetical protein [Clostridium lacusfryxellense]
MEFLTCNQLLIGFLAAGVRKIVRYLLQVVSSALTYANHIWKPTNENNSHGYDTDGIFINTLDSS